MQYYTVANIFVVLLYFSADLLWSFEALQIQEAKNNVTCQACPKGSIGNDSNPDCKACPNKGWCISIAACLKCSPGYFQNTSGQVACLACPVGHYQKDPGQSTCLPCQVGHYQEEPGKSACQECKPGTHQDIPGQTLCSTCKKGFFTKSDGSAKCLSCGYGRYCNERGCTECQPCPSGYEAAKMGAEECTLCFKGYHKKYTSSDLCTRCPTGSYQDQRGQTSCKECPEGFYCPFVDEPPVACGPSQVCPEGSTAPLSTCTGLLVRNHDTQECELSSVVYVVIAIVVTGVVLGAAFVVMRKYKRHNEQKQRLLERQHPVYTGW